MRTQVYIPTEGLGRLFYGEVKDFCLRHKLPIIEEEDCIEIICCLLEDLINNKLNWTKDTCYFDDLLAKKTSWYDANLLRSEETKENFCQYFYIEIIDRYVLRLSNLLNEFMGNDENSAWMVWHTTRVGGDIFLESSKDYRVMEFERLVITGKIKIPKKGVLSCRKNIY